MVPIRRDIAQRVQDKGPFRQARMRQNWWYFAVFDDFSVSEEIEIKYSCRVRLAPLATELSLDFVEFLQQLSRRELGFNRYNTVHEIRLI